VLIAAMLVLTLAAFIYSAIHIVNVAHVSLDSSTSSIAILVAGIVSVLTMSEVGSLTFYIVSELYPDDGGRSRLSLQVGSAFCALVGIVGNATANTVSGIAPGAGVFTWMLSVGAPVLVLLLGHAIARLYLPGVKRYRELVGEFQGDLERYAAYSRDPKTHPDYLRVLGQCLLDQLKQHTKPNRMTIETLMSEGRNDLISILVRREYEAIMSGEWGIGQSEISISMPTASGVMPLGSDAHAQNALPLGNGISPDLALPAQTDAIAPFANDGNSSPQVGNVTARDKVLAFTRATPGAGNMSYREIAKQVGVDHKTVSAAMKETR
jgi:hypothetical protein